MSGSWAWRTLFALQWVWVVSLQAYRRQAQTDAPLQMVLAHPSHHTLPPVPRESMVAH
jgi:hypothetical protein